MTQKKKQKEHTEGILSQRKRKKQEILPPNIRYATIEDVRELHKGGLLPMTSKVWAIDYNGKLAGIFGATIVNDIVCAFSEIKKDTGAPKITIWRTALKAFSEIKKMGNIIIAEPDCNIKGAAEFLKRLGFKEYTDGTFRYNWSNING